MIFPFTFINKDKKGSHATNWAGLIVMKPNVECFTAVWAQESYEAKLKLNPIKLLKRLFSKSYRRKMEIRSHEIETQVAVLLYGVDEERYRAKEALSMFKGYDGMFKNMVPATIERHMREQKSHAEKWIRDNRSMLAEVHDKYGK